MPARRFIPATLVAAGLWSVAFSVLGYVFWQSFDHAATIAKNGTLGLMVLVVAIAGAIIAYRTLRTRAGRDRLRERLRAPGSRSARPAAEDQG